MTRHEAAICRWWGYRVRGYGGGRWEVYDPGPPGLKRPRPRGWLCRLFYAGWWHHKDCLPAPRT